MRKILITGKSSYVGNSVEKWLLKEPENYQVDKISLKDDDWKNKDLSQYDSILHVAGIAHVSSDPKMKEQYYKVNRDLTIEVAKKAKVEGVKQFVFMSSMIVYGNSGKMGKAKMITKNTIPQPADFYGDSKLQAEKGIVPLQNDTFKVAVIRPPMIYGKDSKGNYPRLAKAAKFLPVFPNIDNARSMIHIDNLCEFLKLMIDDEEVGVFFPQNSEYVQTSEMVRIISNNYGKKMKLTKMFNIYIHLASKKINMINKVFGNLTYEFSLSNYRKEYRIRNLKESIKHTESRF